MGENGILFGTAYSKFGAVDANGLNGVRTATLGQTAIVNTDPARIAVGDVPGLPTGAVEKFKLKYRTLPTGLDITGPSKIEFVLPNEQVLGNAIDAPLITEGEKKGTGEIELPAGFKFPKSPEGVLARPRLVVNVGKPEELVGLPKSWNLSPFEVRVAGSEENDQEDGDVPPLVAGSIGLHIGDVETSNDELIRRQEANPEAAPNVVVAWTSSVGEVLPPSQSRNDGHYEVLLTGDQVAGRVHTVTGRVGDVVVGKSNPVPMRPGTAAKIAINLPNDGVGADGYVPADGTTLVPLAVVIEDSVGNRVEDGTPVTCRVDGYGEIEGELKGEKPEDDKAYGETVNGVVTFPYRTAKITSVDKVIVEVDGLEEAKDILNFGLTLTLQASAPVAQVGEEVELTLAAEGPSGEPAADGTPVGWLALGAQGTRDSEIKNGQAKARVRFSSQGVYTVTAVVAGEHKGVELAIASTETIRMLKHNGIVGGDIATDTVVSIPTVNGSLSVPVKASSRVEITGGVPGQVVNFELGTFASPNALPEARYVMKDLEAGVVRDEFGRHDGLTNGDVTLQQASTADGSVSYRFAGGFVRIPGTGALALSNGLNFSAFVKPMDGSGGVLFRREGGFAVELVPDGAGYRLRLNVSSGGTTQVLETQGTIPSGAWSEVHGGIVGGALTLSIPGEEQSTPVTGIDETAGDVFVGEGLIGNMDDLRLYHTSGASPPLLRISGPGVQVTGNRATATFNNEGRAFFDLSSEMALAEAGPGSPELTDWQRAVRAAVIRFRVWIGIDQWKAEGRVAVVGKDMAAVLIKMAETLAIGSTADSDLSVILFDVYWSLVPYTAGFTLIRDVELALERAYLGRTTTSDKFTFAVMAVMIAASAVAAKRVRKLGTLADAAGALIKVRDKGKALGNLARWLEQASREPKMAARLEKILEHLTRHGNDTAFDLIEVLEVAEKNWRSMVYLEQTLKAAGAAGPEVIQVLKQTLLAHGPDVLKTTLAVARTADKVTVKVVSASRKIARAIEDVRALKQQDKRIVVPGISRLNAFLKNFGGATPQTRQILERLDDITDDATDGLRYIIVQLGVARRANVFIPDATAAVLKYGAQKVAQLGQKVSAFERKVPVPTTTKYQKTTWSRQYDVSFRLQGGLFLDIDVKAWTQFVPALMNKEAWKLQKDIVIRWLDPTNPRNFDALRWAVPKGLQGQKGAIEQWMLAQFDSRLVRSRLSQAEIIQAKNAFLAALQRGLLEFY